MITDPRTLRKLGGIQDRDQALRFETVGTVPVEMTGTLEHFRSEPADADWKPVEPGARWGGDGITAWFRGDAQLPASCEGRKVFVRARTGGETLFFADGAAKGVFDHFHPLVALTLSGSCERTYHLAFEAYAGHVFPGTQPFEQAPKPEDMVRAFEGVELALEREDVTAFVFELKTLRQLADSLDDNSLRKHQILAGLARVWAAVDAAPDEVPEESWRPKLAKAREIMRPLLEKRNGPTTPHIACLAASHIDTAWLWSIAETWRKCARTFSSVLNLLEQHPEMIFLQPAPYHADIVRREYPELFARIKASVKAGRWEPNGAMWIEPDANMPSGEAFVRQVLVAQRWTREHFGYTGDTLWLPDVFGYSAALPQILRLGRVEFFATTKMQWNDTTRFPYDTFHWKGIDGSTVLTHLNIHDTPIEPAGLIGAWNWVQHKDIDDRRLVAYGHGDGGGGPKMEDLITARLCENLEGCPTAKHATLTDFLRGCRDEIPNLPEWSGELYLELHRGTLTSIAGVKRGNRKSEFALREAEFLATLARLGGATYPAEELLDLWKVVLVNQFHDILPGSSIAIVNDEAIEAFEKCIADADGLSQASLAALGGAAGDAKLLVSNSLSWERAGEMTLPGVPEGKCIEGATCQWVEGPCGQAKLVVSGIGAAPLGTAALSLTAAGPTDAKSPFQVSDSRAETPFAVVCFDAAGGIVSLVDKATGREIVSEGGRLNAFLLGEDIPAAWDNWDIDTDQEMKMARETRRTSREVVADGPLQLRVRQTFDLGAASRLVQDVVFHSTTARIDFETVVEWKEKRRLLKAGFDLDVLCDNARHEIQYGHVERPTHRNHPHDRARFEVCAHKWTDLSENGFGVALLNESKYGVSVHGGHVGLSLIKSGVHPDPRGDEGAHRFTYSLLPHDGGFSVESVIRPAYELNLPPTTTLAGEAATGSSSLLTVDAPNVIVEAVKWAEEGDAFVVRLYDAGKVATTATLRFGVSVKSISETNILEEATGALSLADGAVTVRFRPFEIKTLRCEV